MKKIIFLDLDGTLWTFEKIPSSALKAIELARKNGHKIYINTGRTRCEIPQFLLRDFSSLLQIDLIELRQTK